MADSAAEPGALLSDFLGEPAQLFHRQVASPDVSPVALIEAVSPAEPFVLLDSAGGNPSLCRYSFLAWRPRLRVIIKDGAARVRRGSCAAGTAPELELKVSDPFHLVRQLLSGAAFCGEPASLENLDIPITGGAFGLVSYDACRYVETLPRSATDDLGLPDLDFIFPSRLICFDHSRGITHLLFSAEENERSSVEADLGAVEAQLLALAGSDRDDRASDLAAHTFDASAATRSNMSRADFVHMVERAKDYIVAGDIFQSNLSQRLEMDYIGGSLALYDALRRINPSPFAGYLSMGGYEIISSSPERLVGLRGRNAQTRPIAGTRRRGVDDHEEIGLTNELNLDPKERAEHIMLVDLERNDMGRVCDYGTVEVDELMVNESYSHVIHIVSNVRGSLHDGRDALHLLRAMFPGGTITGCPKVRCMEIIDELEPVRRGAYTGSFGYIGFNGNMDMNIVIRTLVRVGDRVYGQAGAGIVADSDPAREYRESLRKAEAMAQAVQLAGGPVR